MFRWLFLVAALAVVLADKAEPEAAESGYPVHPILEDYDRNDCGRDHLPGYGVCREVHPSGYPLPRRRIEEQDRIVYDRFSPTYSQPTWVLDYRYLKTGGRDYVRGDGGQILILPKGMRAPADEKKEHGNFDELLEFLRLQELAEREKLRLQRNRENNKDYDEKDDERDYDAYRERDGKEDRPVGWQRELERERRIKDRRGDERREKGRLADHELLRGIQGGGHRENIGYDIPRNNWGRQH